MLYFNMGGVRLKPGRMYAMTYQNVSRDPVQDWFSTNSPTVKASEAGPNGRNTLDPRTPGAIAGLDPREALAWSTNGGRKWVWGRRVGEGFMRGSYPGSRTDDGGVRLPWYGWQPTRTGRARSNQPYYAYKASGRYTLTLANAPRAVRLTRPAAMPRWARASARLRCATCARQAEGRTEYLGGGIAVGRLSPPVPVKRGRLLLDQQQRNGSQGGRGRLPRQGPSAWGTWAAGSPSSPRTMDPTGQSSSLCPTPSSSHFAVIS